MTERAGDPTRDPADDGPTDDGPTDEDPTDEDRTDEDRTDEDRTDEDRAVSDVGLPRPGGDARTHDAGSAEDPALDEVFPAEDAGRA